MFLPMLTIHCLNSIFIVHFALSFRFKDERMYPVSARKALTSSKSTDNSSKHVLKRATIMMAVASLALILCWLPNQVYFLLAQLGYFELKPSIPVRVVGVLVFSNSFMNPVIYGFMNKNFRKGYRKLLMPWTHFQT